MAFRLRPDESIESILKDLDPLVIAIGLALASLAPGPAGEAGAIAAIAFDIRRKRWDGVLLSAASMIPIVGYVPAAAKVGYLVLLLHHRLRRVEASLTELAQSPEQARQLVEVFGKYQHSVPQWKITRRLRERLDRIAAGVTLSERCEPDRTPPGHLLAIDAAVQAVASGAAAGEAISSSVNSP